MITQSLAKHYYVVPILLYLLTSPLIRLGRQYFEGAQYDVSRASTFGDAALCVMFGCGMYVMTSRGATVPAWVVDTNIVGLFFLLFVVSTSATLWVDSNKQTMDMYHNIVVVPLFLTLVIMFGTVLAMNGRTYSFSFMGGIIAVSVWAGFFMLDLHQHRLEQRAYIEDHDPELFARLR